MPLAHFARRRLFLFFSTFSVFLVNSIDTDKCIIIFETIIFQKMQQQESSEKPAQSEDLNQNSGSNTMNNEGDVRPRGSRRGRGNYARGTDRGGKRGDNSRTYNMSNYGATEE